MADEIKSQDQNTEATPVSAKKEAAGKKTVKAKKKKAQKQVSVGCAYIQATYNSPVHNNAVKKATFRVCFLIL